MTCFISRNLLTDLVDDALADAREAELREHLSGCAACTTELQELRRTRALLRSLPVRRAPVDFLSKVKAKAERKSPLERISLVLAPVLRLPRPAVGGLALAASLMVAVTVAIRHDERPEGIFGYGGGPSAANVVSGRAEPKQEDAAPAAGDLGVAGASAGFAETNDELAKNQAQPLEPGDGKLTQAQPQLDRTKDAGGAVDFAKKSESKADAVANRTLAPAPAPAATPVAKPGLYSSTPGQRPDAVVGGAGSVADRNVAAKSKAPAAAPAAEEQDVASLSESAPEPAFDVESTTIDSRSRDADKAAKEAGAKKRGNERRQEAERPRAASAPAGGSGSASAAGSEAMGAPSSASSGDDWGGGEVSGSTAVESVPIDSPGASMSAEKTPAKVAQSTTATGAVATINARFSSGAANGPAIVADAARAAGGKLISGNPPALGKSGASTSVVVELPVAALAALEETLDAQGTLDLLGTPTGTRVRLRIEVVRE